MAALNAAVAPTRPQFPLVVGGVIKGGHQEVVFSVAVAVHSQLPALIKSSGLQEQLLLS